ncbi:MAG TPA: hypothetical protein DCQ50_11765 [Chryseobacterium sp.]|nr:hypothetical protein [Chryseobacterium sp.]
MINEFKIINSINESVELIEGIYDKKNFALLKYANTYSSVGDFGSMVFQKVPLSNLSIWFSQYQANYELLFKTIVQQPVLEAHITLHNKMIHSLGRNHKTVLDKGEFNITYTPHIENKTVFPKSGEYISFDIHPDPGLLKNLSLDFPSLDGFINASLKNTENAVSLFSHRSFMDIEMENLSCKIIQHLCSKEAKKGYVEVLSMELLILFLLRNDKSGPSKTVISKNKNIEALLYAKELIEKQVELKDADDLYDTEIQIAEKVGLSLFQFKSGFKTIFGVPPYQMLLQLRLYKARSLLQNTSLTILEIALKTGYQSRESFAKAYKKFFNAAPSDERN